MFAEEVFCNCYNFSPVTKVKKGYFHGIMLNYPEQGPEP